MRISRIGLFAVAALMLALPACAESPAIGSAAPDFALTTLDGKSFSLAQTASSQNATVLMFIATKCPYSNAYNDRMPEMAEAYKAKGVLFVGINPGVRSALTGHHFAGFSNRFWKLLSESALVPEPITYLDDARLPEFGFGSNKPEPLDEAREHAKTNRHSFPIMKDPDNKVADLYDAKRPPEVCIVDKQGKIVYHGRIDENHENPKQVTSPDLKNALDAMLTGKPIEPARGRTHENRFDCRRKNSSSSSPGHSSAVTRSRSWCSIPAASGIRSARCSITCSKSNRSTPS